MKLHSVFASSVVGAWLVLSAVYGNAADKWGLKEGTPELKSAAALAFGPDGILIVGDAKGAALFAIATGETKGDPAKAAWNIDALNEKLADLFGASPQDVAVNDLAVNPLSGNVYLAVSRGQGADAKPGLVRIEGEGKLSEVSLKSVAFSQATLPNPPEDKEVGEGRRRGNRRGESITDMAYVDGKIIVSGLSSEAAPSTIREIAFPFAATDQGTSIEIYHGAHGRVEDNAVARAFVPFVIDGEPNLLAGFQCTPLVKFPLSSLTPGTKVRGTTVAELGNRNRPLDMIVYKKDGKNFLLMANSSRGVMKISTDNIERAAGIDQPVSGGGTAGQTYDTISDLKGVVQLDRLNDQNAVILVQAEGGALNLSTIALP